MAAILPQARLKRIAEASCECVKIWKEGVSLEKDSGKRIQILLCATAADRWKLGYVFRAQANTFFATQQFRSAISRYYYSMYHTMRACVFIHHEGDDHEKHSELPLHIPPTLDPAGTDWQTKLKDARLLRNRVDYEAYPKSENAWRRNAITIRADANQLVIVSRSYLKLKGCLL